MPSNVRVFFAVVFAFGCGDLRSKNSRIMVPADALPKEAADMGRTSVDAAPEMIEMMAPDMQSAPDIGTSPAGAISVGDWFACAVVAGKVKCWGLNQDGRLGNGSTTNSSVPVDVLGLPAGVTAVTAGRSGIACALTQLGGVKCWELGFAPADVSGLTSGVGAISAGYAHVCALTQLGGVKCWGENSFGELGSGQSGGSTVPVSVVGLSSGVAALSVGNHHACVKMQNDAVKCWGNNRYGALGNGQTTNSNVPVDVRLRVRSQSHSWPIAAAPGRCSGAPKFDHLFEQVRCSNHRPAVDRRCSRRA